MQRYCIKVNPLPIFCKHSEVKSLEFRCLKSNILFKHRRLHFFKLCARNCDCNFLTQVKENLQSGSVKLLIRGHRTEVSWAVVSRLLVGYEIQKVAVVKLFVAVILFKNIFLQWVVSSVDNGGTHVFIAKFRLVSVHCGRFEKLDCNTITGRWTCFSVLARKNKLWVVRGPIGVVFFYFVGTWAAIGRSPYSNVVGHLGILLLFRYGFRASINAV